MNTKDLAADQNVETRPVDGYTLEPKVLPSEALYGFMGWLTCREKAVTFSGSHEAGEAAVLVDEYCKSQGFEPPRDGVYPDNLLPAPPSGRALAPPSSSPAVPQERTPVVDRAVVRVPRSQLEHWREYWNGNANEKAMADALDHILSEIECVLSGATEVPQEGGTPSDALLRKLAAMVAFLTDATGTLDFPAELNIPGLMLQSRHRIEDLESALLASEAARGGVEQLLSQADNAILYLTMHHNSNPDYVRGFDLAQDYMHDRSAALSQSQAPTGGEG